MPASASGMLGCVAGWAVTEVWHSPTTSQGLPFLWYVFSVLELELGSRTFSAIGITLPIFRKPKRSKCKTQHRGSKILSLLRGLKAGLARTHPGHRAEKWEVVHVCDPSTREVETEGSLSNRPAWSTQKVPGHQGLRRMDGGRKVGGAWGPEVPGAKEWALNYLECKCQQWSQNNPQQNCKTEKNQPGKQTSSQSHQWVCSGGGSEMEQHED